jgi:hypothetical protein
LLFSVSNLTPDEVVKVKEFVAGRKDGLEILDYENEDDPTRLTLNFQEPDPDGEGEDEDEEE